MNPDKDRPREAPLNPALKSTRETVYQTEESTPAPLETTNAREGQGERWPWVWLVVTIACIVLALYFIF